MTNLKYGSILHKVIYKLTHADDIYEMMETFSLRGFENFVINIDRIYVIDVGNINK